MDALIGFIIELLKKIFSRAPILISIDAYSSDSGKILIRNISGERLIFVGFKPKNYLRDFSNGLIFEPDMQVYIYPDPTNKKHKKYIQIFLKTLSGKKHKIKINWKGDSPKVKY